MSKEKAVTELLKLGETRVFVVIRSISRSGMSRKLDFYIIKDKDIRIISHLIAELLDMRYSHGEGVRISGCGMDMALHALDIANREIERLSGIKQFFDLRNYRII